MDVQVIEIMQKIGTDIVTYITVEELKKQIIKLGNNAELKKRLQSSLSFQEKKGVKILDSDIFLNLSNYPGVLTFLQDEEFRKEHLKLDTGKGLIILDKRSKDILLTTKISINHKLVSCLRGWNQEYFWSGSTDFSLPGIVNNIESKLPQNQIKKDYHDEYSRFRDEAARKQTELDNQIIKTLNLELPISDYESEVRKTLSMFSDLLQDYILEYEKLMTPIYNQISPALRKEIGYILYSLQQRIIILVSGLDLLARIYMLEWQGRGDWPMRSLERIGNLAIKFLI